MVSSISAYKKVSSHSLLYDKNLKKQKLIRKLTENYHMLTEKAGFQGPDLSAEFSFPYDRTDDDANAEHETDAGHYFRKDRIGAVSPAADRQQQNEETDNDHLKKQNDPVRRTEAAVFAVRKKDDPRNP